jgi:hypothetical protein
MENVPGMENVPVWKMCRMENVPATVRIMACLSVSYEL